MKEKILDVRHLRTEFVTEGKSLTTVNDVSFSVKQGEIFGIIGESGSGKSVTCRSIIGLLKDKGCVTGGEILYKGIDLRKLKPKEMQKIRGSEIGMIFQEPMTTLNPVVTIGKQITEAIREKMTKREKTERAIELMRLVGIPSPEERINAYAHQFSGGMRQRAMIAIALASGPELLLADEPTTALDVTIQYQIIHLLKELRHKIGMSMIFVTHDLGVASQLCDRIAVMYAGRIMEIAPAREIFMNPKHPYTYGLMRAVPSIYRKGEKLYSIEGTQPTPGSLSEGCPFSPRCDFCEEECKRMIPDLTEESAGHYTRCSRIKKLGLGTYKKVSGYE